MAEEESGSAKKSTATRASLTEYVVFLFMIAAMLWGAWQWLLGKMAEHPGVVSFIKNAFVVSAAIYVLGYLTAAVTSIVTAARVKRPTAGAEDTMGGWRPDDRRSWAVVPNASSGRRQYGMGGGGRHRSADFQPWAEILRHAEELPQSRRVARILIAREEGRLLWGFNVDKSISPIAVRAAENEWSEAQVEDWPISDDLDIPDNAPPQAGGGTVVRRYLEPSCPEGILHTATETPDHPLSRWNDALNKHPTLDIQLRIDIIPLTESRRAKVCAKNVKTLGEDHPDLNLWSDEDRMSQIQGVRMLLRVAKRGPGNAAECEEATKRLVKVLETGWRKGDNRFVQKSVSDRLFDQVWSHGTLDRNFPVYHFDVLEALMKPPSGKARQGAKLTTVKRLPDPPLLPTFDPHSSECLHELMPIGILSEEGEDRMVGIPWGKNVDALFDWTVGASGSGKTWHAISRVVTLAETGRGFLFLDPARTAVKDIKEYVAGRHADRILEIDLQASNDMGEPISAGWNPLDLTVAPLKLRKGRIDNLKGSLPAALFPKYFGPGSSEAPQTTTIIRKALECLLELNYHLPPEIQANLFCLENLLSDDEWRDLVVDILPPRDQKWWHMVFPGIVGDKGAASPFLRPTLNSLEQWNTQNRMQALLGASVSTLRWREIMNEQKIIFVVLNNDGSETDQLLARLIVQEMVNSFKERGFDYVEEEITPFHLFLDEFQSYAPVIEDLAAVFVQELRKYGAKVHFLNQAPSALSTKLIEAITANRTHMFCGKLGGPKDARSTAEAMGGSTSGPPVMMGPDGPSSAGDQKVTQQDLLGLENYHFICQVTQDGKPSSAFELRGIHAKNTWKHLISGENINSTVMKNTGLIPVEERLHHYDALPTLIAHWLKNKEILDVGEVIRKQTEAYEKEKAQRKSERQPDREASKESIQQQQDDFFADPTPTPPELPGQETFLPPPPPPDGTWGRPLD